MESLNNTILEFIKKYFKWPITIIIFDLIYILVLMLLPFIMALNDVGHFANISANQMLAYIGSMSTALCTINLSFVTFWFAASTNRESNKLKKKVVLSANMEEELGIYENRIEIPLKIASDYLYSLITYDVISINFISGRYRQTFYKDEDFKQIHSDKNTNTPRIVINLNVDKIKDFKINKYVKITLLVDVINEGIKTKNELVIRSERADVCDSCFEIINDSQLWSI